MTNIHPTIRAALAGFVKPAEKGNMETRKTIWEQLVEQKPKWIGGTLQDFGDSMDRAIGLAEAGGATTTITDVQFEQRKGYGWFEVIGKEFSCGFNIQYGGVGAGEEGWLTFYGYGGHKWRIKEAQ